MSPAAALWASLLVLALVLCSCQCCIARDVPLLVLCCYCCIASDAPLLVLCCYSCCTAQLRPVLALQSLYVLASPLYQVRRRRRLPMSLWLTLLSRPMTGSSSPSTFGRGVLECHSEVLTASAARLRG